MLTCQSNTIKEFSWLRSGRVPGLDGLRGLAIGLVLAGHGLAFQASGAPVMVTRLAEWGVDLFFAISGFIITLLLLREFDRQDKYTFRDFYWRRALRILPPYLLFLLFVFAVDWLGGRSLKPSERVGLLTLTMNFMPDGSSVTGHIWSLSLEEQFYLVWPMILLGLGPRRSLWAAAAIILLVPAARWYAVTNVPWIHVNYSTFTRLDGIMTGCAVALMAYRTRGLGLPAAGDRGTLWFCLVILGLLAFRGWVEQSDWTVTDYFYHSGSALAMAVIVWIVVSSRECWLERIFAHPVLTGLGAISYGLYLWQQPFLYRYSTSWWNHFPANILIIFTLTLASYFLVERPLQRWKGRRKPNSGQTDAGQALRFVEQEHGSCCPSHA